ncbi:hypothetical protein OIU74_012532 [Salix koriyanagi]|uniref:Retrovirus-related Pol polyprotein from transposon TNT 1-94-like beta-barrel domain-containing protein n=1 Tax=Salix koriyanagi TaxID=2511006 RepID=A0A9Q0T5H0_9ROSI|nr:hypothetical protein OIU74_012532 [Salix koriyanagi]
MKFFLRSQGLWNIVETDADPIPLNEDPTLAQMKVFEEEKLKKDKAITCLHSGVADHIFTKIMNLETPKQIWDKLQVEFEGGSRDKTRLMNVVNQMRLLGETFEDHKIVEKLMMSVPEKFEAKISTIEESCDLQNLPIAELISKLHIQEQRVQMRDDEVMENAFQANWKGRKTGNFQKKDFNNGKKFFSENKSIVPANSQMFPPCSYCKRTNHGESECWFKERTLSHCDYCKKFGHNEKFCRLKKNKSQLQQQANVSEEGKDYEEAEEHLFMALQTSNNSQKNSWLIDSGCTSHMTKYLSIFSSIDHTIRPKIKLGNGDIVQAKGRGAVKVSTTKGTKVIKDVLYIPELNQNLLSVSQMLRNGYEVAFKENFCFITDANDSAIAKIKIEGSSFYLDLNVVEGNALSVKSEMSVDWDKKPEHYNLECLNMLHDGDIVKGMPEIHTSDQNSAESTTHEGLKDDFTEHGANTSAVMVRAAEEQSKCFEIMNPGKAEDAAETVKTFNGKEIDGEECYVREWYMKTGGATCEGNPDDDLGQNRADKSLIHHDLKTKNVQINLKLLNLKPICYLDAEYPFQKSWAITWWFLAQSV